MHLFLELTFPLGSTDSRSNAVLSKPFSTSVLKALTWVFATTTKIYTRESFNYPFELIFTTISTPSYSYEFYFIF